MEDADFGGYATKAGLVCSDGRTIMPEAFKHQDSMTVPLVWQHGHDSSDNILGHAVLENRDANHPGGAGVYAWCYFNETPKGQNAKLIVQHKDIKNLSIYANKLIERSKQVFHGAIKEVSLVLSGANPGALIDYVRLAHSDGSVDVLEDEAIIFTGEEIELVHEDKSPEVNAEAKTEDKKDDVEHSDTEKVTEILSAMSDEDKNALLERVKAESNDVAHADKIPEGTTGQDIYDSMSEPQKTVLHYMLAVAFDSAGDSSATHSDTGQDQKEGTEEMTHNLFEGDDKKTEGKRLAHAEVKTIVDDLPKYGSLKESILAHAGEYGIDDIELLFPDAKADGNGISLISRRMEWVNKVLTGTKHSPFSRIKSLAADLTADEARAKGYVKGALKKDEVIKMLRRVTTPKTIYKKQKLDRDDIVDITDFDIVVWLKGEMRVMLDEEIARAVLVGDNRPADDPDKIDEDHIRPIAYDIDMYNTTVELADNVSGGEDLVDAVVANMNKYKGSGTPTMFTTSAVYVSMMMSKDTLGRRLYATKSELSAALLVDDIVPVEAMEQDSDLVAVVVNLQDYTIGADRGGEVNFFDDFDIDYNQEKYLLETRISGALTRPKSALTFKRNAADTVTPTAPTFNAATGVLTVPAQTGTVYKNAETGETLASGAQPAIASGETVEVEAVPASGYGFAHDAETDWVFVAD